MVGGGGGLCVNYMILLYFKIQGGRKGGGLIVAIREYVYLDKRYIPTATLSGTKGSR